MTDTDEQELTAAQLEELVNDLRALEAQLTEQLAATHEGAQPVDLEQPIGRLSRMDAIQQQNMAKASGASAQRRLNQVGAALAAVGRDEYGYCRRCEELVGYSRLKARPETPYCRVCQVKIERR